MGLMATFDGTAVSLALPIISKELSLGVATSIWIMNSYGLAFTVFLIGAGAVSDRYGNRLAPVTGTLDSFTVLFLTCALVASLGGAFAFLLLKPKAGRARSFQDRPVCRRLWTRTGPTS